MKKLFLILTLLVFSSITLFGQSTTRTTIKGVICDSAGVSIPSTMVMLLSANESALVSFTQTDEKGAFEFRNVKNSGYLLKIQHMSYIPCQKTVLVSPTEATDLGTIRLKIISKVLREVVIKAARAPLKFFGDTIEYDAASFKVPPGSTVEDLLRRLPGIDVDVEGNIKAQGKDVKRLYVEGKTFFGTDPKFATKNLGAEIISKVQFFDEKSDLSRITGVKDAPTNTKAMNLSLKEEFKHGSFGKMTAAAGDQDRWLLRGNYNRFDKKQMLSFIGFGNNTNETGANPTDYYEYKGETIATSNMGDVGTGSRFMLIDVGSGISSSYNGLGLTDNYGGGVNYNMDNNKTKISSSYTYKESSRTFFQTAKQETFMQNGSFKNVDTTQSRDFRAKHYLELCIERTIDTANTFIAKTYIHISPSKENNSTSSLYSDANDIKNNILTTVNNNKLTSWKIITGAIFSHRLKKKGASFIWNGGFNAIKSNGLDKPFSLNRFFEAQTFTDQVRTLNIDNANTTTQFKSGMSLTEPLSKNLQLRAYYNFNTTKTIQDKLTQNAAMKYTRVDSLTAYYSNVALLNCIGTNFHYSHKGLSAIIDLAAQQIQQKGNYALRNDLPDITEPIKKTYSNLLPRIWVSYKISKSTSIEGGYNQNINIPSMEELMPVANVNNPAFIFKGNPDLQPTRDHNYNLRFNSYNQALMSNVYLIFDYSETNNSISYSQTIRMVDKVGMQTITRPENMKGFNSKTSLYAQYSLPLIKSTLSLDMTGRLGFGTTPTFINAVENVSKNTSSSFETTFNLTLSEKLLFGLSGNINLNEMRYSLRNDLNQKVRNYGTNSTVKWEIATKTYFDCSYSYSVYKIASLGFDRNIPLLNASIRQIVGKANRIELRLSAFDIFDKNQHITQSITENYISSSIANTLSRYFLLSFSYNIKGFDLKRY